MPVRLHRSMSGGAVGRAELAGLPQEPAFPAEEYQERVRRVRVLMRERDIDVLLVMHPPNVFYLSGFQSFAVYNDECLVLPADGMPFLAVHPPEIGTALLHTWLDEVHGYPPQGGRQEYLARLLMERGLGGSRLGVEMRSAGVPAASYEALRRALPDAAPADASGLVEAVKATKSPREIEHLRRAAGITDAGMRAALAAVGEGQTDNHVAAAAGHAMLEAGGEYMCLAPIVTSGRRSGILHSTHKRVRMARGDVVLIEVGGCFQRYTSPLMRTASVGEPEPGAARLVKACLAALANVLGAIRPGITADEVARAGWEGIEQAGPGLVFHGNFGYAVGAGFPPSWGDGTARIERGVQASLLPGMVFHHPVALRRLGQHGVAFSETTVVTEGGCEVLTGVERKLVVR